ncbi:MAG TPA: CHAD domain-containing protein [Thermoleophilaceae bacterium]|nr:CHAD domain-containing protein [Thermoleophilaceae bacterium]
MAKAAPIPGFADASSFRDAAAAVVAVRAEEVFEHRDGVLDTREIENVHDMRVATRRLRAALEIFAVCFPKKPHRRLLKEVKALADALGERRDRDVAIAALDDAARVLTATERPGLKRLAGELRSEQAAANDALARKLDEIDADDLRGRLLALAASGRTQ